MQPKLKNWKSCEELKLWRPNSLKIWKQHLSFAFLLNFSLTKTLDHFFSYPLKVFCQSKNNWFPTLIPETISKYYTISVIQGLNSNFKKTSIALIHVKLRKTSNVAHLFKIINDNNNPVYKTAKETLMYRTVLWTLWERERVIVTIFLNSIYMP